MKTIKKSIHTKSISFITAYHYSDFVLANNVNVIRNWFLPNLIESDNGRVYYRTLKKTTRKGI